MGTQTSIVEKAEKLGKLQDARQAIHTIDGLQMDSTEVYFRWEATKEACMATEIMFGNRVRQHINITSEAVVIGRLGLADTFYTKEKNVPSM